MTTFENETNPRLLTTSLSKDRRWRPVPSPIEVLVACGWLSPTEAASPGVLIDTTSSSHALIRVTMQDGREVILKQVREDAAQRGRNLAREMFVYRLAHWMPALAAVVPRPILIDERRGFLVMESLAQGPLWPIPPILASVASSDVSRQLGKAMAAWHDSTQEIGAWPCLGVGILALPDSLGEACEGRPPTTQALMQSIATDAVLAGALRAAQSSYTNRCLIHGDLRAENWMMDGRNGGAQLKVFDWEMAGIGDPAWDIGSILAEAIIEQIRAHRLEWSTSKIWPPAIEAPMRAFLRAYSAGRNRHNAPDREEWDTVLNCAVGRLLHVACECADLIDAAARPVSDIMEYSRSLVINHGKAAAMLGKWAST